MAVTNLLTKRRITTTHLLAYIYMPIVCKHKLGSIQTMTMAMLMLFDGTGNHHVREHRMQYPLFPPQEGILQPTLQHKTEDDNG